MGSSLCCCCRSDPYPPKVRRKEGETWVLRYRVTSADGRRVEHIATVGLVWDFPKDRDAWREVDRLGLGVRINDTAAGRASFHFLAEHYLKADFGADRSEEHTSELQSRLHLVCRLLLEKKKKTLISCIIASYFCSRLQTLHTLTHTLNVL